MPFGDIRVVERQARTTRHRRSDVVERVLARKRVLAPFAGARSSRYGYWRQRERLLRRERLH